MAYVDPGLSFCFPPSESVSITPQATTNGLSAAEPTNEELKAKIAELERQLERKLLEDRLESLRRQIGEPLTPAPHTPPSWPTYRYWPYQHYPFWYDTATPPHWPTTIC